MNNVNVSKLIIKRIYFIIFQSSILYKRKLKLSFLYHKNLAN
jgi:hypothetical protein